MDDQEEGCSWVNENDILNDDCISDCSEEVLLMLDVCVYCADINNDCSWMMGNNECDQCNDACDYYDEQCHQDCDNADFCQDVDDDCAELSCGESFVSPEQDGGQAFCDWLASDDSSCLEGCDDASEFAVVCDYCTNTNLVDNACDGFFEFGNEDDDHDDHDHDRGHGHHAVSYTHLRAHET